MDFLSRCGRMWSPRTGNCLLLGLLLCQIPFIQAYLPSPCECDRTKSCNNTCIRSPGEEVPDSRCQFPIMKCKFGPNSECLDQHSRERLPDNCTWPGHVQAGRKGFFSVNGALRSLSVSWQPPPRRELVSAYAVVFSISLGPRGEQGTLACACMSVPPCVYNTRLYYTSGSMAMNTPYPNYVYGTCLQNLMHVTQPSRVGAKIMTFPYHGDFPTAIKASPEIIITVPSCAELAKQSPEKLTLLCKMKLKYSSPRAANGQLNGRMVSRSTYTVSWVTDSPLPVSNAYLSAKTVETASEQASIDDYSGTSYRELTGVFINSTDLQDGNSTSASLTLPESAVQSLSPGAKICIQLSFILDTEAARRELMSDPEFVAAMEDEYNYAAGTMPKSTLRTYTKNIVDGIDEDRVSSVRQFQTTVDGGWTSWKQNSSCPLCAQNPRIQEIRTCTNPSPRLYGRNCTGETAQSVVCKPVQACQSTPKLTNNVGGPEGPTEKKPWYQHPIFYSFMAAVPTTILLAALLFLLRKPLMRARKLRIRPVDGTRDIERLTASAFAPPTYLGSNDEKSDFIPPLLDNGRPGSPTSTDTRGSEDDPLLLDQEEVRPRSSPLPKSVYISYSRANDIHVENVCSFVDWLIYYGVTVHYDKHDSVEYNQDFGNWIENRMTGADWIIVVMSSHYFNEWHRSDSAAAAADRASNEEDCTPEVALETRLIKTLLTRQDNHVIPVFLGTAFDSSAKPKLLGSNKTFRITEHDVSQATALLDHIDGKEECPRPTFTQD
ncbi:uncharacterized protein LOC135805990 [Sycon ciliatum]|uniref:uncharacterized protein LOC135805990 n=1 Tax=Sycon ciliatum TaxID=27933 RepID=UPI0031F67BB4